MENLTQFYDFVDNTIFKEIMTNIITISLLNESKVDILHDNNRGKKNNNRWGIINQNYKITLYYTNNKIYRYIINETDTNNSILFMKSLKNILEEL